MNSQWMNVRYLTHAAKLEALLPPGFALRGEPVVSVSLSFFNNLYWLAGRGYGILVVDFPVTYKGKSETIEGNFCPVLWEGCPDAILTGREELGFPKLFADIPDMKWDKTKGTSSGEASWFGHKFFSIGLEQLVETDGPKMLPSSGGPAMYYKYMPRSGINGSGGCDIAYVTTSLPHASAAAVNPSQVSLDDFEFRKWRGTGRVVWNRATFEQLPTTFHVVNGLADLDILEYLGAEMVAFSGPGIGVSVNNLRPVDPA